MKQIPEASIRRGWKMESAALKYNYLITSSGGIAGAGSKGAMTDLSSRTGVLSSLLTGFLSDPNRPENHSLPEAYLNWLVLDEEQFKLVEGNSGAIQIPEVTGTMQKQLMQAKNGEFLLHKMDTFMFM